MIITRNPKKQLKIKPTRRATRPARKANNNSEVGIRPALADNLLG
jgi:hypothetical protein